MINNTERFSGKSENYVKFRPSYPQESISYIIEKSINSKEKIFADIGSGTGIFSKLLINEVYKLYCVEPNKDMRDASEKDLKKYQNYFSINGTAEQTTLPDQSVDFITVAQAFHWFNREKCLKEFKRILKSNGGIYLIWNLRKQNTEFLRKYEEVLLKYSEDYREVSTKNRVDIGVISSFLTNNLEIKTFEYEQKTDWNVFLGRHFSTSYAPKEGTNESNSLLDEMKDVFGRESKNNMISIYYDTKIYYGNIT